MNQSTVSVSQRIITRASFGHDAVTEPDRYGATVVASGPRGAECATHLAVYADPRGRVPTVSRSHRILLRYTTLIAAEGMRHAACHRG